MNTNLRFKTSLKPLTFALALGAVQMQAQTIHVGGNGVIGDTVLTTTGGTALVGVTGATWRVDGGTGEPVSSALVSPPVAVPATGNVTLTFTHRYDFETGWDGGAVLVSVNGNPAVYLAGTAFSSGGYVGTTTDNESSAWPGGENVFYGQSSGFATPSFITSVADLGTLTAGDTVSIQFKGEWDEAATNGPPAWEIGTVKLTDSGATNFLDAVFSMGGSSGFTAVNGGSPVTPLKPWVFTPETAVSSFEINGDTLAADRYAPDIPGSVFDLSNAAIVVELLVGTLDPGDTFTLFDLSGGTTLSGTPVSISLPPLGIWDSSNLATNGTITFVSPPPNLTWNLTGPGDGAWDELTANWTENGVDPTVFVPGANVTFDKADGGVITVTQDMAPSSTTVDSAGTYKLVTGVITSGTAQSNSISSGTLIKNGAGALRLGDDGLTATNVYSNGFTSVTVNAGSLIHCSPEAFGSGTVTIAGGVIWTQAAHEGRLGFAGESIANDFILSGGLVNVPSAFNNENKGISITGDVSGPGGFSVTGAAGSQRSLGLSGDNTFSGGVSLTVTSGNTTTAGVEIGSYTALGTGTFSVSEPLAMNPTTPRGGFRTIANLPGSVDHPNGVINPITIANGKFFNVYCATASHTLQLGGVISGNGTLNKWKGGTVILSGANTYTGGTRVDQGTLTINGSLADATLSIVGGNTFAGTVNGTGTLTVNINGASSDQISITGGTINGNLVATNLNLLINPTGDGLTEPEYILVNATGGGTITSTFAGITGPLGNYQLNYDTPGQVKLIDLTASSPYEDWATGDEPFEGDANGDGVIDGLAFLLGAGAPGNNSNGLLPGPSNDGTGLVLEFQMRNAAARGDAKLSVQWSNDLGVSDPWGGNVALVPDDDMTVNGVIFDITAGSPLNTVKATIPLAEAAGGKLFGRVVGTEN